MNTLRPPLIFGAPLERFNLLIWFSHRREMVWQNEADFEMKTLPPLLTRFAVADSQSVGSRESRLVEES